MRRGANEGKLRTIVTQTTEGVLTGGKHVGTVGEKDSLRCCKTHCLFVIYSFWRGCGCEKWRELTMYWLVTGVYMIGLRLHISFILTVTGLL
jgi:hypothetical protein